MINCLIVDDAPLAVEKLAEFVRRVPSLRLSGTFDNGVDALEYLYQNPIDLLFLDMQMERLSGLELIRSLADRPRIIIVSAYSKYAIEGFEENVSDYLLKPYSFERFLRAVDKVQSEIDTVAPRNYMFVKTEYRMERIDYADILYIEGQGAYLRIITSRAKVMTLMTFARIEELLPPATFLRIHKSYIVALDKIDHIERNSVVIGDQRIPIGRNYRDRLHTVLQAKNR